jgi:hypothetical protein
MVPVAVKWNSADENIDTRIVANRAQRADTNL